MARFIAGFCLLTWLMLVPLSGLKRPYGQALRGCTNLVISAMEMSSDVRIKVPPQPQGADSVILIRNAPNPTVRRPVDTGFVGYLPTVCGISLALATPIPWRRRVRSVILVALLVQVFVATRMATLVIQMFLADPNLQGEVPGLLKSPVARGLLYRLTGIDGETTLFLIVPMAIWAIVTLRVEDIKRLWPAPGAQESRANP